MSKLIKSIKRVLEYVLLKLLSIGPVPGHVALIMDGNRRYAKQRGLPALEGHRQGFNTLRKVIAWLNVLGVNVISPYIFSTANFKRTRVETQRLLDMIDEKLCEYLKDSSSLLGIHCSVQFCGEKKLVPQGIQSKIEEVETLVASKMVVDRGGEKHISMINDRVVTINACVAYSSTAEIVNCINKAVEECVKDGSVISNMETLMRHSYLRHCRDPDFIIRTSGVNRLSDFLLMQGKLSIYEFPSVFWPEFGFLEFVFTLLRFQLAATKSEYFDRYITFTSSIRQTS